MANPSLWKTKLHLMPPAGWLNDPNGLCQFHGTYHIFFQYRPEDPFGTGSTGWGHYVSPDLLRWTFAGTALAPDRTFDRDGVYSGSALVTDDQMYLYYTGNVKQPGGHDYITSGREAHVVLVESKDGAVFGKKEHLLSNADYPASCTCHVRDPKVWRDGAGFHMVLGARFRDGRGGVLLYHSPDGRCWTFGNTVTTPEPFGYMWECPDSFALGSQTFLSISPQGLTRERERFQNVYQSGYFIVDGGLAGNYTLSDFCEWDMGFDFYAPQTFLDESGRRILIGWMGLPDIAGEYENPTTADGWQHVLTVPRELFPGENGSVCQRPVSELEALRGRAHKLNGGDRLDLAAPFDMTAELDPGADLVLSLYGGLTVRYDRACGMASLEFDHSGAGFPATQGPGYGRTVRRARLKKAPARVRILADTSAAEIFWGEGETVMSTRVYPESAVSPIALTGGSARIWEMDGLDVRI